MELRLFPLQHSVVFPGMAVPLNVFEPRYHQLVEECERDGDPFGIVLIREGSEVGGFAVPHDVGTTVRIESTEPATPVSLSLVGRGERRFRILESYRDRPYLWGDVELIEEPPGGPDIPGSSGPLADAICATGAGEPDERQRLLETLDPAERLAAAVAMFDPVLDDLHRTLADALTVRRWGEPGGLN